MAKNRQQIEDEIKRNWAEAYKDRVSFDTTSFLSPKQAKLYTCMLQWANRHGCWPTLQELAVRLDLSISTIVTQLTALEKKDVIFSLMRGRVYRVGKYEMRLFDTRPEKSRRAKSRRDRSSIWSSDVQQEGKADSEGKEVQVKA